MTFTTHVKKLLLGGMALCLLVSVLTVAFVAFSPHSALAAGNASPTITKAVKITTVNGIFAFMPKTLKIVHGTTVKWTNTTTVTHTVTSDTGLFNSGLIAPGGTFSFTFKRAGTFTYHCTIHPFMKGKIVVS